MIKVFIVDDHYMIIEGIRSLLGYDSGIEFVGSASNSDACFAFLRNHETDIILMDINLPDCNGIELCAKVKATYPHIFVLGLSTFNQGSFIKDIMNNGASGYILKNVSKSELINAIKTVIRGKTYLAFEAAKALQAARLNNSQKILLGRREKEVLILISEGFTNNEIAIQLNITSNTVDTYRKNLLHKTAAKNTAELVKIAIENKLI